MRATATHSVILDGDLEPVERRGYGQLRPRPGGRVLALCPAGIVSGGPELLHQFVYHTRSLGIDADLVYYPFERTWDVPAPYRRYIDAGGKFRDAAIDVVVVPEAATGLARQFKCARKVIWWLSFDNYFRSFRGRPDWPSGANSVLRWAHGFRSTGEQLDWRELNSLEHLSQSHYAAERLRRLGLESTELSDYLREDYLTQPPVMNERSAVVAYYPLKGKAISRRIRESLSNVEFQEIVGMDAAAVLKVLRSCAVYIDFGHHPGKDRLPREAAISGACVVTGRRGSAGDSFDVPIPPQYKIDESAHGFLGQVGSLLRSICADPSAHSLNFERYREAIRSEPARFVSRLRTLLGA